MAKLFESNNRERRNDDVMKILVEVLPSTSTDLILLDDLQGAENGRTTRSSQASREIREVALATDGIGLRDSHHPFSFRAVTSITSVSRPFGIDPSRPRLS
jgi:hypothetical protein